MYKVIDDTFIGLWNQIHTQVSTAWITHVHTQLAAAAPPPYHAGPDLQTLEIRIAEHWLKTMVWQLCQSQGMIGNVSSEECMTYRFPIYLANGLFESIQYCPLRDLTVHSTELVSKLHPGQICFCALRCGHQTMLSCIIVLFQTLFPTTRINRGHLVDRRAFLIFRIHTSLE